MNLFRRLSTPRLLLLLTTLAAGIAAASIIAVTATGGAGAAPAGEPLAQAVHDALAATPPQGVDARVTFTNNLLPSSSLLGNVTSALISGASGRLWLTNDGRGRIELQSDAGDTQIVWDASKPNGQPRRQLDVSRAERLFGFRAATGLREGIERTVAWYRAEAPSYAAS